MENISDYNHYNAEMEKALADKLFFLEHLEGIEGLVDFGCADGALLEAVSRIRPELTLCGMDMDAPMLAKAKERVPAAVFLQTILPTDCEELDETKAAINFSSVLHEVYSYCTEEQISDFWAAINGTGYSYIAIRDMICNVDPAADADPEDVWKVRNKEEVAERLKEFEAVWGPITKQRNLIHFLLKYRYVYNWSREVKENYIPLTGEAVLQKINPEKYEVCYREEFILPFIRQNIQEYFGITLKDATHIKLILKRR